MERVSSLYHEQQNSGQLVARTIYVDFRENFGNFSSSFAQGSQSQPTDPSSSLDTLLAGNHGFWNDGKTEKMVTETI